MRFIQTFLLLTFMSIASSELPAPGFSSFNGFGKFRPSQNLDSTSGTYEYTQYNPNDFILNLKTSPQRLYGLPEGHEGVPPNHHNHDLPHPLNPHNPQNPHNPPQGFYNAPHGPHGPIYQKPQSYFSIQDLKPPQFQKPLFTPAGGALEYPATHGQVNNYNKALQEELQQQLQQQQQQQQQPEVEQQSNTAFANGFTGYSNLGSAPVQPAKSYVNVKLGPANLQYQYHF